MNRIISKEEEREDPRRDSSIYLRVQWCFHIPTRFLRIQCILQYSTRNPAGFQSSRAILHTELILLQELQGSSHAGSSQQLFPVSPSILHSRIRLPAPLQHSKAIQHKQASSELYPVEAAFQVAGSIHAVPTVAPRPVLQFYITEFYQEKQDSFKRVKYCMSIQY